MTDKEAQEIIHLIEGSFTMDLGDGGRSVWRQGLAGKDYAIGLETAVMIARTMNRRPTLKDVLDVIAMRERDQAQTQAKTDEEAWRTRAPRPPAWVFGWAIARYRDNDLRLWPEQEEGYRQLRADHLLGYEWDPKNVMPEAERTAYTEQGRKLSSEQLWKLIDAPAWVVGSKPEESVDVVTLLKETAGVAGED